MEVNKPKFAFDLFHFAHQVQDNIYRNYPNWPDNWVFHMHPRTWMHVKNDTESVQYIIPGKPAMLVKPDNPTQFADDFKKEMMSNRESFLGCSVILDPGLPIGMIDLRYCEQMFLQIGEPPTESGLI